MSKHMGKVRYRKEMRRRIYEIEIFNMFGLSIAAINVLAQACATIVNQTGDVDSA